MDNKILIDHRKKIDKIDKEINKLIEKRLECAKEIGKYKKKNKMRIVDIKREKEVLGNRVKQSKLDKGFTKKLFSLIIKKSREAQF